MKSIEELNRIKEEALRKVNLRQEATQFRILVGMATCGIAAGARPVMRALMDALAKESLPVSLQQTGCIGMCRYEPIVEVIDQQGEKTSYLHVTPEIALLILEKHIKQGEILSQYTKAALEEE